MTDAPVATHCPDCEAELDTVGAEENRPIHNIEMSCPDCSFDVTNTVLWYPHGVFELIAEFPDSITTVPLCSCGKQPNVGVMNNQDSELKTYCVNCLRAHHRTAVERTVDE